MPQHESLHVSSLLDRCPCEMSSLSWKVQRDATAPGNLRTHYTQTPSCLTNERIVSSRECSKRLTIYLGLVGKLSVGATGGCLFIFFVLLGRRWHRSICGEFLSCHPSKAVKTETCTEICYRGIKYGPEMCCKGFSSDVTGQLMEHGLKMLLSARARKVKPQTVQTT